MAIEQKQELAEQEKNLSKVIKIDEVQIQSHLDMMVRDTVEQILNELLDAEADNLYKRTFHTKAGAVELNMPKHRKATFETDQPNTYRLK